MRRRALLVLTALALLAGTGLPGAAQAAPSSYQNLDPGGPASYQERVPVNVVFVGYDRRQAPPDRFREQLAQSYDPIVRSRKSYGIDEPLGIHYTYDYNLRYTGPAYADTVFRKLSRLARPAPRTLYQKLYNQQESNVLTVKRNHHISGPAFERWLAYHPPTGINTHRNTIYFINWYGRSDFKHHVYVKTNEPDPDTGYNFGELRESRKLIAWGGTTARDEEDGLGSTRRVWFYDLSAGPESWTENWNVDTPDLDGDGVEEYRMPPIWEYASNGYRAPSQLAGDLGRVTRYVALDLLMTTSPLYPVDILSPDLPWKVNLDSNTYEGWPGVNASKEYITRSLFLDEMGELLRGRTLSYDNQDLPFRGDARRCYVLLLENESCYPTLGYPPFANLFLYNAVNLRRTKDDGDSVHYELPIFNYAVGAGVGVPALGYADDNYRDGTQSFVFNFVSPEVVEAGYGLTTTMIHEVGHHVSLSHPHDGWDSESNTAFGPSGPYFFAWSGDQSNTMMSYIDLNWDFSQFDQDNMRRYQAAAFTESANTIAAAILADPDAAKAADELAAADEVLGRAEQRFSAHEYRVSSRLATRAYKLVNRGARQVGLDARDHLRLRIGSLEGSKRSELHPVDEFIDTLQPDSPRSQP